MPKLRNVTDVVLRYLDAKQHLWNSYFWGKVTDLRECEPLDSFEAIDRHLFFALVCSPLNIRLSEPYAFGQTAVRQLIVRAKPAFTEIKVRVSRPATDGNRYFELPAMFPTRAFALSFIEFFQWDRYGFWSCGQVRCRIHSATVHTHIDKDALVDLANVDFFLDRTGAETT